MGKITSILKKVERERENHSAGMAPQEDISSRLNVLGIKLDTLGYQIRELAEQNQTFSFNLRQFSHDVTEKISQAHRARSSLQETFSGTVTVFSMVAGLGVVLFSGYLFAQMKGVQVSDLLAPLKGLIASF